MNVVFTISPRDYVRSTSSWGRRWCWRSWPPSMPRAITAFRSAGWGRERRWPARETPIEARGDVLRLNPELPEKIERLDMRIRYRGHSIDLRLTRDSLTVRGRDGAAAPISLCVDGKVCEYVSGSTREFRVNDAVEVACCSMNCAASPRTTRSICRSRSS